MAHLYGAVRRYVNYFQPSFKLVEKTRHGSGAVKRYSPPATPCDRLMQHDAVSVEMKAALSEYRAHCLNKTVTQRKWLPQIGCYRTEHFT